jgi:hypothetical protein
MCSYAQARGEAWMDDCFISDASPPALLSGVMLMEHAKIIT